MKIRNASNQYLVDKIKELLRDEECIIEPNEIDAGATLHIEIRYFSQNVDVKTVVDRGRNLYLQNVEKVFAKNVLFIVKNGMEEAFFDPSLNAND